MRHLLLLLHLDLEMFVSLNLNNYNENVNYIFINCILLKNIIAVNELNYNVHIHTVAIVY